MILFETDDGVCKSYEDSFRRGIGSDENALAIQLNLFSERVIIIALPFSKELQILHAHQWQLSLM